MAFHPLKKIDIDAFLKLAESIPVIDVRSPSEFNQGHIPGAFNIPLFDDSERAIVGTRYKKEGRDKAIIRGIELSGPQMHRKLQSALEMARESKLLVHCWRGGMRSEAMAWLFSLGDIETEVLDGGYKSYRHHVLAGLAEKKRVIVLGGMTGSSKTRILRHIGKLSNQVIDLEALANHKGSAFGALGQPLQPSSEHFSNLLFDLWKNIDDSNPVWLEDESRNIGTVFMPDAFYDHIQLSPAIILMMSIEKRLPKLIEEYSTYPQEQLRDSVLKISKRLGGDNTRDAIAAIDSGDFAKAIEITLKYYDKAYLYSISKKHSGQIIFIETDSDDIEVNSAKVLEASKQITY
ncbi:MAG: tRNA 2-selenouridine(34) synthase MnmH [Bacteroidales bacterium]|jgi:tRNA 2-selenouridine synthase|nr:tRNA 2-selenouridine(34) synthase MnmH [Bacteroidales bacterium]